LTQEGFLEGTRMTSLYQSCRRLREPKTMNDINSYASRNTKDVLDFEFIVLDLFSVSSLVFRVYCIIQQSLKGIPHS